MSFPKAVVSHIDLHTSDHQLLEGSEHRRKKKFFRFEAMWLDHPEFGKLMGDFWNSRVYDRESWINSLISCRRTLGSWNNSNFGSVQRKIKELKSRFSEVKELRCDETSRVEEARLAEELDTWLAREETLWIQRSMILWLIQGDKNTKFFHARATYMKKKNWSWS
ncbi:hypothetical protein QQ045_011837 [Rhodiola kirilowii]